MVPGPAGISCRFSPDRSKRLTPADGFLQQPGPSSSSKTTVPSLLETIQHRQPAAGISAETSRLLAAGWSNENNRAYQSAWRKWDSWCSKQQVDLLPCHVQYFLEFLTSLCKNGTQYRSINVVRSAIATTLDHIEGTPMGQHPLVSRLLRGCTIHDLHNQGTQPHGMGCGYTL